MDEIFRRKIVNNPLRTEIEGSPYPPEPLSRIATGPGSDPVTCDTEDSLRQGSRFESVKRNRDDKTYQSEG